VARREMNLFPLYRGERFRDRLKQWVKHKLEHIYCIQVLVGSEVAIYYPYRCGGVLHHADWWALVKPDELDDIVERFASDEADYHICKRPEYNAKWWKKHHPNGWKPTFNPLANDENISIICSVCRSYDCCRPKAHLPVLFGASR